MTNTNSYIRLDDLSVGYNGKAIIRDICVDIEKGDIISLIGPNGAGKSTILKSITRQLSLIQGKVIFNEQDLHKIPFRDLSKKMAVVLTERMKTDLLTCYDIVASGRYPYTGKLGILSEEDERKVDEAIAAVHASELGPRDFNAISDGQRQRILLARAICQEPNIIILDEPTSFLDVRHKLQLLSIQSDIKQKTRFDLDEQQRAYFLQQQLKNIREELGGDEKNPERKELAEKAKNKKWNEATAKVFNKELNKLETINPQSPDYSILVNYLQTMVDLPWNEYTQDNLSLKHAKKVLDKAHYGMEKVKERILEYLAVRSLRGDLKSPILCLYGPPGVGKTSLGKSIAEAMGRKYVRMSLGGLHDESEIRGHRRTYIGAMPGQIIKNIQKAGSSNPVFILDEIDKVTQNTINGNPASALLEVLDPEQNNAFHDNYLDTDYDLSKVLFIATANDISSIPRPLLDRMELIEVGGYIIEEKVEIVKRHLVPRELKNTGLDKYEPKIKFTKAAIEDLIDHYTRESGVRQLEKAINKALRKMAYKLAYTDELEKPTITPAEVEELLGKPIFTRDIYQGNKYAGVVTGLAWTSVGGEILFIETSLSKSKAAKLTLTGNLGDVMKESAVIALEYVKAHADLLGIDYRIFENWNIHIHVPEGATPKDGPSAGITIATSIASALTQRKVRKNTAMTGEITLRGKVLPVGGIKEKILAAKRAGITDIVICQDNKKDIEEIPEIYRKGVEFHYVENVADVWHFALTDEKVEHPIDFTIPEDAKKGE